MKRKSLLLLFLGIIQFENSKGFSEEELTIDLYLPKYALTGMAKEGELSYAMPSDPVTVLGEIIDPKTEHSVRIIFVNNMNAHTGDGSFDNPYSTLKAAENGSKNNDIIYVYRGDGTQKGMDNGIILKDSQHLLGSNHSYEFSTKFGTFYLPATTREAPVISNADGNCIELGNQNEVHGFVIDSPKGWAIHGKEICEGQIRHLSIVTGSKVDGAIGLENVLGHFEITDNCIKGTGIDSVNGIDIRNHGISMANFTIQGNQISHFGEGIVLHTFDRAIAVSHIEYNTIGACSKHEVETKAFDNSETLVQ